MKAIVRNRYGPPGMLRLAEVEPPAAGDGEVLVRVEAAGVNTADVDYLRGRPYVARFGTGWPRPRNRVLGLDVAGTIESVGSNVTRFRPGDDVFGDLTDYGFGAFAECVCAPERAFAPKPAGLTFEEAAVVPQSAVMALQGLGGTERIRREDEVLINGAGGGVGQFAVQIAKSLGAEVTGVDGAAKLDLVRSVGADHVVDSTREDYTKRGRRYDRILDVAVTRSVFESRRALKPGGSYVAVPGSIGGLVQTFILGPSISIADSRTLSMLMWKPFEPDAVAAITELIEASEVRPVIDRSYRLEEVGEALRYQGEGRSRGKVVVVV